MTTVRRDRLVELDAKAKAILDAHSGLETWDVKMLREVVAIARPEHRQAAQPPTLSPRTSL